MALEAAAEVARAAGIAVLLGDSIEGEARDVGKVMAAIALQVSATASRWPRPACCCPAARPP
jgi:hydroxypyruvate reductase